MIANGKVEDGGGRGPAIGKELTETLRLFESSRLDPESQVKERDPTVEAGLISKMNEIDDLSEPTNDLEVYRYYLRSVGWLKMALFVAFVFIDVFCHSFTSKSCPCWITCNDAPG